MKLVYWSINLDCQDASVTNSRMMQDKNVWFLKSQLSNYSPFSYMLKLIGAIMVITIISSRFEFKEQILIKPYFNTPRRKCNTFCKIRKSAGKVGIRFPVTTTSPLAAQHASTTFVIVKWIRYWILGSKDNVHFPHSTCKVRTQRKK